MGDVHDMIMGDQGGVLLQNMMVQSVDCDVETKNKSPDSRCGFVIEFRVSSNFLGGII